MRSLYINVPIYSLDLLLYFYVITNFFLFYKLTYIRRIYRVISLVFFIPISIYFAINLIEDTFQEIISPQFYYYQTILHSLYYYLPSFLLMILLKLELIDYNQNNKTKIPNIVLLFIQVIIIFIPSLFVLSNVFSINLTGILATSGVLTVIVGLAIQPNLSNILSGLFVNLESPFSTNDWVTIDNKLKQVINIS